MESIGSYLKQVPSRISLGNARSSLNALSRSLLKRTSILIVLGLFVVWTPLRAQVSRFAYVVNEGSNAVSVYTVDRTTGALTLASVTATGNVPSWIALDPAGRFAFVTNNAESGGLPSISVYGINPNTGALTEIPGSPFPTGQPRPNGIWVHPSGKFVYSAGAFPGSVLAFSINSSTGALTPVPGSPYPDTLYPGSVTTDSSGKFLFVANADNPNLLVYGIDPNTGALTPSPGSPFPAPGNNHDEGVVDPTGRFYYVSSNASQISAYSIDPNTGALSAVIGSPFSAGSGTTGVTMDPTGHFVYAANQNSGDVSAYKIDPNTGALTPVLGSPFPSGNRAILLTVDPTGTFLYVANFGSNNISAYAINPNTGALTLVPGSPFASGTEPVSIAVLDENSAPALSILPTHGGNTGNVTVQLFGGGVQNGATVKLTGLGPDILGTTVTVLNGSMGTSTFNLTGVMPGVRDVVVVNPDGTSATLTSGFTVEQGGAANISVEIIGRSQIRFGKQQTYYMLVRNSGKVDGSPGLVSLSVPPTVQYGQQSGPDLFSAGVTSSPEYAIPSQSVAGNQNLIFATSGVPPGGSQYASAQLTLPIGVLAAAGSSAASNSSFTLTAGWQQDLDNMSLDQFLGLEGIPFIPYPTGGCLPCLNNYSAELFAHSDVGSAYFAWVEARDNFNSAVLTLPTTIAATVTAALLVQSAGLPALGGLALNLFINEARTCAQNLFSEVASGNQSCLIDLEGQATAIGNADISFLNSGLATGVQQSALRVLSTSINILVNALKGSGNIFAAWGAKQAALGQFQQALGPYSTARAAYQACLSTTHCMATTPPTPPPPPGTTSLPVTGVSSLDPNDKVGNRGVGVAQYVSSSVPLSYAVYFSNETTATAPAQQVTLTDQLDAVRNDLDSLSFGPLWFENQLVSPEPFQTRFSTTVDLRPVKNLLVAISANLNRSNGLATWSFQSLDASTNQPPTDPTVGFLPPGGEGGAFFTVRPKQELQTNSQIQNQATVVFDVNPPINTPTWTNTIDNTPPASHVIVLPAFENSLAFPIQWTGSDVGAGVQDFTIYASDDGGPFVPFQTNTIATSATFTGQAGHTYAFYSIARDLVGNVETAKTVADATTQLILDTTPPVTTAAASPGPNPNGWNNTNVTVTLASSDNEPNGTGVKQITYSATGAQAIASTTVHAATASLTIITEGVTSVTFFGTDNAGNVEAPHTLIVRLDKTPPTVACSASPNVLWPPNNKLVPINVSVNVSDALSGPGGFTLVSVTSNEPDSGQGDIQGFLAGTASTSGQLRAQRLGSGTGRVYTFTYSGADRAGNTGSCTTTVTVPHDQGQN
jgi:6-phosphogluconolactonase (cycloisomerase 2 family)